MNSSLLGNSKGFFGKGLLFIKSFIFILFDERYLIALINTLFLFAFIFELCTSSAYFFKNCNFSAFSFNSSGVKIQFIIFLFSSFELLFVSSCLFSNEFKGLSSSFFIWFFIFDLILFLMLFNIEELLFSFVSNKLILLLFLSFIDE
jgi:hypothetical protein